MLIDPADASKDTARELVVKRGADTGPATTLVVERRFEREVQSASYEVGLMGGTVGGELMYLGAAGLAGSVLLTGIGLLRRRHAAAPRAI